MEVCNEKITLPPWESRAKTLALGLIENDPNCDTEDIRLCSKLLTALLVTDEQAALCPGVWCPPGVEVTNPLIKSDPKGTTVVVMVICALLALVPRTVVECIDYTTERKKDKTFAQDILKRWGVTYEEDPANSSRIFVHCQETLNTIEYPSFSDCQRSPYQPKSRHPDNPLTVRHLIIAGTPKWNYWGDSINPIKGIPSERQIITLKFNRGSLSFPSKSAADHFTENIQVK